MLGTPVTVVMMSGETVRAYEVGKGDKKRYVRSGGRGATNEVIPPDQIKEVRR